MSQTPTFTILVYVPTGDEVQVHFQDLTHLTGHKSPETRLFHVMFDDDVHKANLVLDLMSHDFQDYFEQLRAAKLVDPDGSSTTNPLRLPKVDGTQNNQFAKLQTYLQGLYHSPICDPDYCPCSTMLVTTCCPDATVGVTVGCHLDCMDHNLVPPPP